MSDAKQILCPLFSCRRMGGHPLTPRLLISPPKLFSLFTDPRSVAAITLIRKTEEEISASCPEIRDPVLLRPGRQWNRSGKAAGKSVHSETRMKRNQSQPMLLFNKLKREMTSFSRKQEERMVKSIPAFNETERIWTLARLRHLPCDRHVI